MKYIVLIIAVCNLFFVACGGIPNVLPQDKIMDLISQDPEILITGEFSPSNDCTHVYTISKRKLQEIGTSNIGFDLGCDKVDVNRIVDNCRDYAMNAGVGSTNVLKLVSLEMAVKHIESDVGTNDVWYARASFTNKDCDWGTAVRSGEGGIVVYALLDGEVLKPRTTAYSRYIDQERKKFLQSKAQGKSEK